jgi:membrane protein implicated in regulation of membrane protease activity
MEKPHLFFAALYGYAVCFVAVIVLLISVAAIVSSAMELSDPLHARAWMQREGRSLASYETYKLDVLQAGEASGAAAEAGLALDDQTIRAMYDAERADRIQTVTFGARKDIVVSTFLAILSIILFAVHWRWVRRLRPAESVLEKGER